MNPRRIAAVAERIALGFRRDRRSLGLLFGAPLIVLSLVGAVWGSSTQTIPTVVVATDRVGLPPQIASRIVDSLLKSDAIKARAATFDEGVRDLKGGSADAIVWFEGTTLHIEIEGSDPLRSGSLGQAVQKALGQSVASAGLAGSSLGIAAPSV